MKKKQLAWVLPLLLTLGPLGCDHHRYERGEVLSQLAQAEIRPLNDTLIVLKGYLQREPADQEIRQAMADLLFAHQEYTLAINQYDKLFKEGYHPDLTLLRLLQCHAELGAYPQVLQTVEQQQQPILAFQPPIQAAIHQVLAIAHLRMDHLTEAAAAFERAKQDPQLAGLVLVEAELALKQGNLLKAERLLKERADPTQEETNVLWASLDFANSDYLSASARYTSILSRVKPSSRIYQEQVIPYFFSLLQSNQTVVLAKYIKAKKHKMPEGLWQFGQGLVFLVQNDWKEAQNAFVMAQKELQLDQIDYFLALIHWQQNNTEQALLAIQQYLAQGKNLKVASQVQAGIYLTMRDFSKSEAILQRLLIEDPADPTVQGLLAQVYYQSGHLDRWYQLLKQHPHLSQQHLLAYLATAIQLENNADFQRQLSQLETHAFLDRQSVSHYEILQLLSNGEFNLAKDKIDTLLQTDPNAAMTYQLQGLWALTHNDLPLAASAYEKAVSLSPDNMGAVQQRAVVALKQNYIDEAKQWLQTALKQHPDQMTLTLTLAHAYVIEQQIEQAVSLVKKDLATYPHHQGARLFLASIYRQQQQYDRAEEVLKEGLAVTPKDTGLIAQWLVTKLLNHDFIETQQGLANPELGILKLPLQMLALVLQKKPQSALDLLQQYPTNADKMLSQVLAWLTEGQQLQAALPWVDLIIKSTPADHKQWLACAEVYLKTEQSKKALLVYEQILKASPADQIARNNYDWLRARLTVKVL